jgi:ubiquinone/menaquinone biosynthesis C-methylase UbiE
MQIEKFNRFNAMALASVYSEQEENNFHTQLIPQMVDKYVPLMELKKDAAILDVGCGYGTFQTKMAEMGYTNTIGITLSDEDYKASESKGMTVIKSDFSDVPSVQDESVDMIWCRHALEHSPYPLFTLYEFNRLLKVGGKVYVEVPAPDCKRQHESNPNHYSILGLTMWMFLFARAGFDALMVDKFQLTLKADGQDIPEEYLIFLLEKKNVPQVRTQEAG